MNSQDTLCASHLLERVGGSQLAGEVMRVGMWGTQGILWLWVDGRASGRGSRRRSGGRSERRVGGSSEGSGGGQLLSNGGSFLIRWRLISRIEGRERIRVREGNWGFCSQKDLGRGARGAERRFREEIRKC
jgi:hypothetical protein